MKLNWDLGENQFQLPVYVIVWKLLRLDIAYFFFNVLETCWIQLSILGMSRMTVRGFDTYPILLSLSCILSKSPCNAVSRMKHLWT